MNISKEAIEAAAVAMSGWRFIEHEPGCGEHTELSEPARTHYARAALEAAAPMLIAQALRDSADDFKGEDLALDVILAGPDAVRHHLNSRADVMTRVEL